MYVIRPDVSDNDYANTISKFEKTVGETGGQVVNTDEWDIRNLAFESQHHEKGYYILMAFKSAPDQLKRLEERLKLDEHVLRYQIVKNS
jgi:small subunit ribosomal protein S6